MALLGLKSHLSRYSKSRYNTRRYIILYFVCMPQFLRYPFFFCLAAKMRARMLRAEKFLVIGNKIASVSHLKSLLQMFGKDVHLLKPEDLNAKDKMNYASCERLCQPHVRKLLKQHVSSIFLPLF